MAYEIPSEGAKRCMIYQHDPNPVAERKTDEQEESTEGQESSV